MYSMQLPNGLILDDGFSGSELETLKMVSVIRRLYIM